MKAQFTLYHPSAYVQFHMVNDGSAHAFNYWHEVDEDDGMGRYVSREVSDFFDAHK